MQDKHIAVTERIVAELERGCAPWVRPWEGSSLPRNATTQRFYRGINVLWLWAVQESVGYPTADWLSFRQALHMGGNVRKGEKGTPIFFYRMLEREDDTAKNGVRKIPLLRSYTVFNVAQCENLPALEQDVREPHLRADRCHSVRRSVRIWDVVERADETLYVSFGGG